MNLIQQQEDKFIEGQRKDMPNLSHDMELAMRVAYADAAFTFRIVGQHEGDNKRKQSIIDALGLVEERESC